MVIQHYILVKHLRKKKKKKSELHRIQNFDNGDTEHHMGKASKTITENYYEHYYTVMPLTVCSCDSVCQVACPKIRKHTTHSKNTVLNSRPTVQKIKCTAK